MSGAYALRQGGVSPPLLLLISLAWFVVVTVTRTSCTSCSSLCVELRTNARRSVNAAESTLVAAERSCACCERSNGQLNIGMSVR